MHFAGGGKAGKAAIGAGYDILAPDCLRKAADALGDQLGMLDDIRGMRDDAGDDRFAFGQFHLGPHFPFMLVARVGGLERVGACIDPQHDIDQMLQLHVVHARSDIDAVAGVIPDAVRRQPAQRMVQHLDASCRPFPARLDARLGMHDVVGGEERVVDLQHEPRLDDRAVFLAQRIGQRIKVFFLALVVLVAVPIGEIRG